MDRITYASSGVDIAAGDRAKEKIARLAKSTFSQNVLTQIGLFAGAYDIGNGEALMSSADGVGTKIMVATQMGIYNTVGVDLVHHCANDIAVHNADPLFFLDYIGHSALSPDIIAKIVEGLAIGCLDIGAALIGGETAQMPGIYPPDEFDLVGFIVGRVKRDEMITGAKIAPGDIVIGLPANGLHTNGYSLARMALFDAAKMKPETYIAELGETIGEALLKIHPLYLNSLRALRGKADIRGMAHITGGGVKGNLVRVLPEGCRAQIAKNSAPVPPIFALIRRLGQIEESEMFSAFNMGFGYFFIVAKDDADNALRLLGAGSFIAGEIVAGERGVELI